MNFLKTSFYTSISTAVSFLSGFILIKVIALKIGPQGIAQVGQFQNTTALFAIAGTASLTTGVVKYLAEYHNDQLKKQQIISTAFFTVLLFSLCTSIIVICGSRFLSFRAFHTPDYQLVYVLFGSFMVLTSLNTLFLSVLNGLKEIRKFTLVNVSTSLAGVLFTVLLANSFGVKGVLVAANCTALTLFILNLFISKSLHYLQRPALKDFHKPMLLLLLSFTLMSVVSGIMMPAGQFMIRDAIINKYDIQTAGYWQAVTKISDYYLLFITTIISVYYLPVLSALKEKKELKKEILKGYKVILPAVLFLALIIFFAKDPVIRILFTPSFLPAKELFLFQLIGDFLKIASWMLAFLMYAKAMVKTFIITEIVFTLSLVLFSRYFLNRYGIIGTTYAFALNYALYLITMIIIMMNYLSEKRPANTAGSSSQGL